MNSTPVDRGTGERSLPAFRRVFRSRDGHGLGDDPHQFLWEPRPDSQGSCPSERTGGHTRARGQGFGLIVRPTRLCGARAPGVRPHGRRRFPPRRRRSSRRYAEMRSGFPRSQIDHPDNLVRISTLRHWEVTAWYQQTEARFAGLAARQYFQGRSCSENYQVGLNALRERRMLKP